MTALAEEKATPNEFARIAWSDLYDYLRTACDGLSREGSYDGLRIGLSDSIKLERPTREHVEIVLFLNTARVYGLSLTFDRDLLHLRYQVDGDGVAHDLLAVSEGDVYGFQTRERSFKTAAEVGRSMLATLTACK
jgi:hypothetical protein